MGWKGRGREGRRRDANGGRGGLSQMLTAEGSRRREGGRTHVGLY